MQYTYNKNLETLTNFHHQTKNRHNNMCLFYIYLHLNLFLFKIMLMFNHTILSGML